MNAGVFVNGSLRIQAQNPCNGDLAGDLMDLRFLESWVEEAATSLRKAIWREQEDEMQRAERERGDEKRKREEDDRADRLLTVLMLSEESRQIRQILNDIDDAVKAAGFAYARALRDAEAAQDALDEARRQALVLPDGRRAYFDASGRLFLEDGAEVTDAAHLDAAGRARNLRPDATSYESYLKKYRHFNDATARVEKISETLQRLRDLKQRVEDGKLTPDELAQARKELDAEVRSMSPEMREEYERIRAARNTDPDPAASAPTVLSTDFTRASQAFSAQNSQAAADPGEAAKPAYKQAPEF
jgi:hypothetical protein